VIDIPEIRNRDKGLLAIVIIGLVFTAFAWIGDIASWAIIGNGFLIDIILLFVAIAFTAGTLFVRSKMKKKEVAEDEIDEDLKELQELEEAEAKMEEELDYDIILSCSSCGSLIAITEDNCPSCGSAKPVCVVCLSDLKGIDEIVKLSCCSSYAHKEHIDNWVSVKGHCPKCHREIQDNQEYITPV